MRAVALICTALVLMVLEPEVVMVYLAALVENEAQGWLYWPVLAALGLDIWEIGNGERNE